ncbi:group 1 glycosyl transferase [Thermotoga sp. Mc24]|nr:group 1 glycosyl transferase [Thermotoga sp. 2812B]EJX26858.1 group 1 glycosyl transferase [Thermotoga sp. EMP]KHC90357.1 group 1 glycosyl transferase [Thermotoga sp. Mc24]
MQKALKNLGYNPEISVWFSLNNDVNIEEKPSYDSFFNYIDNRFSKFHELIFPAKNPYCARYYRRDFADSLCEVIKNLSPEFILFANLPSAVYLEDIHKILPSKSKIILIEHNVESLIMHELGIYGKDTIRRFISRLKKKIVENFEKQVLAQVDLVISISEYDKQYFVKHFGIKNDKILVIPPLFDFSTGLFNNLDEAQNIISFIGSMDWYPNILGVHFFVENVLPKLIVKMEDLKFYIVGRNPVPSIFKLQKKYPQNIIVTGTVDNVEKYYKMSDAIVIPIFTGSGAKIKVLEAIASGVPTVMTSFVAKDYDFKKEKLLIADTPEDFAEKIRCLLTNKDFAKEISKNQEIIYQDYITRKSKEVQEMLKRFFLQK